MQGFFLKNLIFICVLFFGFGFNSTTEAKVFNLENQTVATYLRGNYSTSMIQQDAFVRSSGDQTIFGDDVGFNWGGELGFVFFTGKMNSVRVGLQMITPEKMSNIKGNDSVGAEYLSLESSILGTFPIVHLDFYPIKTASGRMIFSVGGGYGKVSLKNNYNMTAAGTGQYSLNSFEESASQYTYLFESSVGFEMSFAYTTTVVFDLGYRYAVARELKYDEAGTNFLGNHNAGDAVLDNTGEARELNLGGIFAGITFRFYFN